MKTYIFPIPPIRGVLVVQFAKFQNMAFVGQTDKMTLHSGDFDQFRLSFKHSPGVSLGRDDGRGGSIFGSKRRMCMSQRRSLSLELKSGITRSPKDAMRSSYRFLSWPSDSHHTYTEPDSDRAEQKSQPQST